MLSGSSSVYAQFFPLMSLTGFASPRKFLGPEAWLAIRRSRLLKALPGNRLRASKLWHSSPACPFEFGTAATTLGEVGAHVLGYMGKPTAAELRADVEHHYRPDGMLGRFGLEKS